MQQVKFFVRTDNTATIICPACKLTKNIPAGPYKEKQHTFKVRCPCGEAFQILLDFRSHYRKEINLLGTFINLEHPEHGKLNVQIKDISMIGIGFVINGPNYLKVGQELMIEFTLDDRKKTELKKKVIVKNIRDNFVGCQIDSNEPYEKALGFFLQN